MFVNKANQRYVSYTKKNITNMLVQFSKACYFKVNSKGIWSFESSAFLKFLNKQAISRLFYSKLLADFTFLF